MHNPECVGKIELAEPRLADVVFAAGCPLCHSYDCFTYAQILRSPTMECQTVVGKDGNWELSSVHGKLLCRRCGFCCLVVTPEDQLDHMTRLAHQLDDFSPTEWEQAKDQRAADVKAFIKRLDETDEKKRLAYFGMAYLAAIPGQAKLADGTLTANDDLYSFVCHACSKEWTISLKHILQYCGHKRQPGYSVKYCRGQRETWDIAPFNFYVHCPRCGCKATGTTRHEDVASINRIMHELEDTGQWRPDWDFKLRPYPKVEFVDEVAAA